MLRAVDQLIKRTSTIEQAIVTVAMKVNKTLTHYYDSLEYFLGNSMVSSIYYRG